MDSLILILLIIPDTNGMPSAGWNKWDKSISAGVIRSDCGDFNIQELVLVMPNLSYLNASFYLIVNFSVMPMRKRIWRVE